MLWYSDLSIVDCLSLHIYYFHLSFPVLIAVLFISLSVIFGVAFWRGVLVWCPGVATRNCPYFARLYDVVCGGVIFWPTPAPSTTAGACSRRHTDNLDPLMTSSTNILPASKHNHRRDGGRGDRKLISRGNNLLFHLLSSSSRFVEDFTVDHEGWRACS